MLTRSLEIYNTFNPSSIWKNYVDGPTRYAETRKSCIDLVMTEEDNSDGQSVITSCTPKPTLVQTDHELVRTTLSLGVDNPAEQIDRNLSEN